MKRRIRKLKSRVGNYVTNRVSCVKSYACTCISNSKSVQTYIVLVREHAHEHVL